MTRLLHCADLHLEGGEDREYSLGVLDEIVSIAAQEGVDLLLICGDLFDSFADAEALRGEVRTRIGALPGSCRTIYIPGNHEELRRGGKALASLDLGPIEMPRKLPFELLGGDGVELLCIPHQPDYRGYHEWVLPEKRAPWRLALAHGMVTGVDIYAGPESEESEQVGAIDPDLFVRFGVDYAALGHIHQRRALRLGTCEIAYPGSARVWRRGETGPRTVHLVGLGSGMGYEPIVIRSAGQYREHRLPLSLDGSLEGLDDLAAAWDGPDWVDLRLSGIVEDENTVAELERAIRREISTRVRRLGINREGVQPLPGILSQPLARRFLESWKRREPAGDLERERARWLKARELGLDQIKRALEAREC